MWLHQDYARLTGDYERLYQAGKPRGLGKGLGTGAAAYDSGRLQAMAAHLATIAPNEYTTCMWLRRGWLHASGRDGEVYDGTDARLWYQAMQRAAA